MDPTSFLISSPDIATTPDIATGSFIYETGSGRFFFFQRNISAAKDEDDRYCPVCGNLRKAFVANEAARLRLNALLAQGLIQEINQRAAELPHGTSRNAAIAATLAKRTAPLATMALTDASPLVPAAGQRRWRRRGTVRQFLGVFSKMKSRAPPQSRLNCPRGLR